MTRIRTLSDASTRRIKQTVDIVLGRDSSRRGGASGGYLVAETLTGRITARQIVGGLVNYTAQGEFQTSIVTQSLMAPLDRCHNPAVVVLSPATVGSRCTIVRIYNAQDVPVYRVGRAYGETWTTTACDSGGGAGLGTSGIMTVSEHSRDDRQLTYGSLTAQAAAVTAAASTRFGFKIYDFPAGYILIESLILSLRASAPSNTNTLLVSAGTTLVTGDGTTLTGTAADIMPQTTMGSLLSSAVVDFAGHTTSLPAGDNGTTTALDLYLNFAPTAVWSASENITISQPPTATRAMSMAWRSGGLLP